MEKLYQQEVAQKGLEGAKILWKERSEARAGDQRRRLTPPPPTLQEQQKALERKQAEALAGVEMSEWARKANDEELAEATRHYDELLGRRSKRQTQRRKRYGGWMHNFVAG